MIKKGFTNRPYFLLFNITVCEEEHVLEVSITIFSIGLQDDCDCCHQGLHHTELKCGLWREKKKNK